MVRSATPINYFGQGVGVQIPNMGHLTWKGPTGESNLFDFWKVEIVRGATTVFSPRIQARSTRERFILQSCFFCGWRSAWPWCESVNKSDPRPACCLIRQNFFCSQNWKTSKENHHKLWPFNTNVTVTLALKLTELNKFCFSFGLEPGKTACTIAWWINDVFYVSYVMTVFFICFVLPLCVMTACYYKAIRFIAWVGDGGRQENLEWTNEKDITKVKRS